MKHHLDSLIGHRWIFLVYDASNYVVHILTLGHSAFS